MSAFLTDGTVNLRPVTRADLPQLAAWRNDPELRARTREFRPLTDVDQERWLERISGPDRRDFMFVVERTFKKTPAICEPGETPEAPRWVPPTVVGVVGLCNWDSVNASAEVSFYIGDKFWRGKGCGAMAVALLQAWGFRELRLNRVWAEVYAFNAPSIKLLDRLGYKHEGTMRQHVHRSGEFVDALIYGLLAAEWSAKAFFDNGVTSGKCRV